MSDSQVEVQTPVVQKPVPKTEFSETCQATIPLFDYSGVAKEHSTTITCSKLLTSLNIKPTDTLTCEQLQKSAIEDESSLLVPLEKDFTDAYSKEMIPKSFGGIATMVANNCMLACFDEVCDDDDK